MERLKGKTLLIGREEGKDRLLVAVQVNGQFKMTALTSMGKVPNSVSRCKPAEGKAHCRIDVEADGRMKMTNLKESNATYVNGMEISTKTITEKSEVMLGRENFYLKLDEVLAAALKILDAVTPQEFSIAPLKQVWDDYHNSQIQIKKRQKNIGLLRSIPLLFSMLGGLLTALVGPELRFAAVAFTIVAVLFMIYGFYKSFSDKSIEETEELTEKFQSTYICPNPKCHHFMGNVPFNVLKQNTNCPYCKAKFKK